MAKEEIERELKKYIDEYGERSGLVHLMNNFLFNLPTPSYEQESYRKRVNQRNEWDVTYIEFIKKVSPNDVFQEQLKYHSDLKLNQTPRQFFETIDKVLEELNIPVNEVKRLLEIRFKEGKNTMPELYKLTLSAYLKLREMGYTRQDLVA